MCSVVSSTSCLSCSKAIVTPLGAELIINSVTNSYLFSDRVTCHRLTQEIFYNTRTSGRMSVEVFFIKSSLDYFFLCLFFLKRFLRLWVAILCLFLFLPLGIIKFFNVFKCYQLLNSPIFRSIN